MCTKLQHFICKINYFFGGGEEGHRNYKVAELIGATECRIEALGVAMSNFPPTPNSQKHENRVTEGGECHHRHHETSCPHTHPFSINIPIWLLR